MGGERRKEQQTERRRDFKKARGGTRQVID